MNIETMTDQLKKLDFPVIPAKNQLIIYEEVISHACSLNKNPKVVFLGATSVIRDLCIKHRSSSKR